jgi:hypothetical protein
MKWSRTLALASVSAVAALAASAALHAQNASQMTFFVTSVGIGKGADLGGLAGADAHCAALAKAVGAGNRTWRAYLATQAKDGQPAVDARSRIGNGPWTNAKGSVVAKNVDDLHADTNQLTPPNLLNEKGETLQRRPEDGGSQHDALTGSTADGRAFPPDKDMTCGNWTKGGEGAAMVGHIDRRGLSDDPPAKSWNASHPSRGCSQENLKSSGGAGLFYCFAAN